MKHTFRLTRQFALLSFVTILFIGLVSAYTLSRLLTNEILTRDAIVSGDFVNSIVTADRSWRYFNDVDNPAGKAVLREFYDHVTHLPDALRFNVYGKDQRVIWSSDNELIGKKFDDNDELEEALEGRLVFESGTIGERVKKEHVDLGSDLVGMHFIETYIPIWNPDHDDVVAVVELYKRPLSLHKAIVKGESIIWIGSLLGGMLLFVALYWIVRRADLVMASQQQRLIEAESLSMIGETASAVAHSMRNPLASIRACAELTLTDDLEGAKESARDIINEADRLDRWARELLQFSATHQDELETIDIDALIGKTLDAHREDLARASIELKLYLSGIHPMLRANEAPLAQVVENLVVNAIEAIGHDGTLTVASAVEHKPPFVRITITDTGPGLSDEIKDRLFRPFATTKPSGTGLGLALARRLVEHYGGTLDLHSDPGQGVTATIRLPAVD